MEQIFPKECVSILTEWDLMLPSFVEPKLMQIACRNKPILVSMLCGMLPDHAITFVCISHSVCTYKVVLFYFKKKIISYVFHFCLSFRRLLCHTTDVFKFCWTLFVYTKG